MQIWELEYVYFCCFVLLFFFIFGMSRRVAVMKLALVFSIMDHAVRKVGVRFR